MTRRGFMTVALAAGGLLTAFATPRPYGYSYADYAPSLGVNILAGLSPNAWSECGAGEEGSAGDNGAGLPTRLWADFENSGTFVILR